MSEWLRKLKGHSRNIMQDKPLKCNSLTVKETVKAKSCDELMVMKYMYLNLRGRERFCFGL